MTEQEKDLPSYVQREFEEFLKCSRLEHGFLLVCCESCQAVHLVAFSCKHRGFCPSCGVQQSAESAALLVDEVLPEQPVRQWGLSFPLSIALSVRQSANTGAITLSQRFGSTLNLNIHFHMLFLDGVYVNQPDGAARCHKKVD